MAEIKMNEKNETYNIPTSGRKREVIEPLINADQIVSSRKPFSKRMWDLFVGEDPKDICNYVIKDILVPGAKGILLDMIAGALNGGNTRDSFRRYDNGRVDYSGSFKTNNYNDWKRRNEKEKNKGFSSEERVSYRDIVLKNRKDAEKVVQYMWDRIEHAGSISVAEFYDLLRLPSKFTDNDWGWDTPTDVGIKSVSSGFLIDVAEAHHLT